jgi:hypothetical protein
LGDAEGLVAKVVELEHQRVALAAVDAWVVAVLGAGDGTERGWARATGLTP